MGPSAGVNLNYLLLSSAAHTSGKLHVRVNPTQSMYATYANVKGVPAPEGLSGMSLTGLKVMDSIVANIKSSRTSKADNGDGMDAFRALVNQFHELQKSQGPYAQALGTGLFLDMTA